MKHESAETREALIKSIFGERKPCDCPNCALQRYAFCEELEVKDPPPAQPNAPYTLSLQ